MAFKLLVFAERNPHLPQKEATMLSQCANSQCGKPFLKLRDGKLFLLELDRVAPRGEKIPPAFASARRQQRSIEHFWLCDDCALRWTLTYDRDRGITLTPLQKLPHPCCA